MPYVFKLLVDVFSLICALIMRYVYILACADESLYTWITTDLERRMFEHNHDEKWATYTKSRRPVELVWYQSCADRSDASKEELKIKRLSKLQKLTLIKEKTMSD